MSIPIIGEGTRGEHHWTVEFCGTKGWQVSSWRPHPTLRWVQSHGGYSYALVSGLADLDALIEALTSARDAIAAKEAER